MKECVYLKSTANFTASFAAILAGSLGVYMTLSVCAAESGTPELIEIEAGTASFEAVTNMPGIEVKGKSASISGRVEVTRGSEGLVLSKIQASLPVKSLATGMKVRDEHMRKYIFTTSDGKLPDLDFTADGVVCKGTGAEFACHISGNLSLRGLSRPFSMNLNVRQASALEFRASGDAVVKLSDYGITPPSQFGVKAADEVKLHLEFGGRQAASARANIGGGH